MEMNTRQRSAQAAVSESSAEDSIPVTTLLSNTTDPSSFIVNIDPAGVVFDNNVVTGMESSALDSLTAACEGFFTTNYDHPIIEEGVVLSDMIYLVKKCSSSS